MSRTRAPCRKIGAWQLGGGFFLRGSGDGLERGVPFGGGFLPGQVLECLDAFEGLELFVPGAFDLGVSDGAGLVRALGAFAPGD